MEQISNDGCSMRSIEEELSLLSNDGCSMRSIEEELSLLSNDGQIKYDSAIGQVIAQYAQDTRFKTYLEIGTWNGGGSTYCFAKGFGHRVEQFYFLTLEVDEEKYNEAKEKYKNISYINLERGTILTPEEIGLDSFEKTVSYFQKFFSNLQVKWLVSDIQNIFSGSKLISLVDFIPEVVLLDGSEYLTYFEFLKLQDKTKVFILDDTNTEKCMKIVEELDASSEWIMKHKVTTERNGWAVYEKEII